MAAGRSLSARDVAILPANPAGCERPCDFSKRICDFGHALAMAEAPVPSVLKNRSQ